MGCLTWPVDQDGVAHKPAPNTEGVAEMEELGRKNLRKESKKRKRPISGAGAVGGALPGVDMNAYNGMDLLSISRKEGRLLKNIGYFDLKPKVF